LKNVVRIKIKDWISNTAKLREEVAVSTGIGVKIHTTEIGVTIHAKEIGVGMAMMNQIGHQTTGGSRKRRLIPSPTISV